MSKNKLHIICDFFLSLFLFLICEILLEQLNEEQKKKADRILPGKIEKFLEGAVLLRQIFIKDETDSKTIKDMVDAFGIRCGEKVSLRRFSRLEIGEGIEKVQSNIAADVAAMVGERN